MLVMIGILLALQVNNWNNGRIDASREQSILKNLRVDFKNNIDNVNDEYNSSLEAYQASVKLLEIIKGDDPVDPTEIELLIDDIINKIQSLDIITGSLLANMPPVLINTLPFAFEKFSCNVVFPLYISIR